jgi:hypothetical protein
MLTLRHCLHAGFVALFVGAGALIAAAPPAAAAAKEKSALAAEEKKARSKECSAEADKQGLHGKERQKFRSKCKREGKT